MEPVAISMDLEAVVRQVDKVVIVLEGILVGAGAYVALCVHVDLEVVCYEDPYSDVELATFIQKRLLQVLLNYPVLFHLFLFNELPYSLKAIENLDPFALVQI